MKNDKKTFLKNTFYLYAMNIIKLVFPLLTLPYLTRVLSTSAYGTVTYVKAIIVYVQLVLDFGFMLSATKNIVNAKSDESIINRIIGNTIAEKAILGVLVSIIYFILIFFIPIMSGNKMFCILYLLSVLSTIFILDFLYRGIEKMKYVAIPYIISKTITTILTFVLVSCDDDLILIPLLDLIGNFIAAVLSLVFLKKVSYHILFSNLSVWFSDIKDSFVYFISNFATTIFGALTTIVAGIYISTEQIAFWGICMQILSAAKSLYNPITNSIYPYMLRNKDIKIIYKTSYLMLIPMILGTLFVIFWGNQFMSIIGGSKYYEAGNVLKLLLPAFVFSFYSMLFGWPVLGSIGREKETSISTIAASLLQVAGFIFLSIFNSFTLYNLAICCSISEVALFVIRYCVFFNNKSKFNNS